MNYTKSRTASRASVLFLMAGPGERLLHTIRLALAALLIPQLFGMAVYGVEFKTEYTTFAGQAKACKKITLFEGLPHSRTEATLFAAELAKDKSFKRHEHHFYNEALDVSAEEANELVEILLSHKMFRRFEEEKLCGGFHPDYMVEWSDEEGKKFCILICLGCHETECYGAKSPIFCDMTGECFAKLAKYFSTKRRSRPNLPQDDEEK